MCQEVPGMEKDPRRTYEVVLSENPKQVGNELDLDVALEDLIDGYLEALQNLVPKLVGLDKDIGISHDGKDDGIGMDKIETAFECLLSKKESSKFNQPNHKEDYDRNDYQESAKEEDKDKEDNMNDNIELNKASDDDNETIVDEKNYEIDKACTKKNEKIKEGVCRLEWSLKFAKEDDLSIRYDSRIGCRNDMGIGKGIKATKDSIDGTHDEEGNLKLVEMEKAMATELSGNIPTRPVEDALGNEALAETDYGVKEVSRKSTYDELNQGQFPILTNPLVLLSPNKENGLVELRP
ncbi:28967_t:CDS:2 [Gigaspora margarita]|uniref:28967_t:CDS:1 n=1 Tax=Gigaspora margarita TaxID=4874 RepID=A0ABM8VXX5_GIGMA|nr:28967_t:CDS:2 [Gigaspora margarita]